MKSLPALFGLVLAGCPVVSSSCPDTQPSQGTDNVSLTAAAVARFAGDDGVLSDGECNAACAAESYLDGASCVSHIATADGGADIVCSATVVCEGRRPAGLRSAASGAPDVGAWLARAAHAEAASVCAFRRLHRELVELGAPEALCAAAQAAAADEVRHARTMRALAQRHGATATRVEVEPARPRPLVELAVENVVEGCVHETWAAVVALLQARQADDPTIAAAMAEIAVDEARHAELAFAVHEWATPRLSQAERRRVAAAGRRAVQRLATLRYASIAGLPVPAQVRALHAGMVAHVWGATP